MSIITPSDTALAYLQQFTPGQQRFDISELSDTTGHTATRLGGPPRWTAALRTLDALEPAISALWKSIALRMRGRVNHLALYDITQPQPRGTARGTLATVGATAAGASSLAVSGALASPNLLNYASFETDTNADGIADGWARYSLGSVGTLSQNLSSDAWALVHGTKSQYLQAASLGSTINDRQGINRVAIPASQLAGGMASLSAYVNGSVSSSVVIEIGFHNGSGTQIGYDYTTTLLTGSLQRISVSGSAPLGTVFVNIGIWQHSNTGASPRFYVDAVQLEAGAVTAFSGFASLLDGDWLQIGTGVGSHYCMVIGDAAADDAGNITVTIEPPTRKSFAGATAVTWDKPKAHYKQRPDSLSWSGAAGSSMVGGFAFDLIEDWSA